MSRLEDRAEREVHKGKVVVFFAHPNTWKEYRIIHGQDKALPKNTSRTFTLPDGKIGTILRKDENGYNSEYVITFSDGQLWKMIGVIFTANNPQIRMREARVKRLVVEIERREDKVSEMQKKLNSVEKALHPKLEKKKATEKWKKPKQSTGNHFSWEKKDALIAEKTSLEAGIKSRNESIVRAKEERVILEREIWELQRSNPLMPLPYIPYNEEKNTPEMRQKGMIYLGRWVTEAYRTIASADPEDSRDFITHTPASVVLLLNLVERMDYHEYIDQKSPRSINRTVWTGKKQKPFIEPAVIMKDRETREAVMERQLTRSLTVFGLNGPRSYNAQISLPGASGVAQLMPETYNSLRKKYPKMLEKTPESFYEWAIRHDVALQYQAIHIYDQYRQFPSWIRTRWDEIMRDPRTRLGIMTILACGYNGTMKRVIQESGITDKEPENWREILDPDRLLSKYQTLRDPEDPSKLYEHAAERYTYALKFQYLYRRLGQERVK